MATSAALVIPPRPIQPMDFGMRKGELRQFAGSWMTWTGREWVPADIDPRMAFGKLAEVVTSASVTDKTAETAAGLDLHFIHDASRVRRVSCRATVKITSAADAASFYGDFVRLRCGLWTGARNDTDPELDADTHAACPGADDMHHFSAEIDPAAFTDGAEIYVAAYFVAFAVPSASPTFQLNAARRCWLRLYDDGPVPTP